MTPDGTRNIDLLISGQRRTINVLVDENKALQDENQTLHEDVRILGLVYRTTLGWGAERDAEARNYQAKYYRLLDAQRQRRAA